MAFEYRSKQGDTVDYIAWKYYGTTSRQVVERLLNENQGLADMGPVLPMGTPVHLPDIPPTENVKSVRLW